MGERWLNEVLIPDAAERLETIHWDGKGCGTHDNGACSHCFGPSPMLAEEIVQEVLLFCTPALQSEVRTTLISKLNAEKSLHDGAIWKAAIDRCIELIKKDEKDYL